ncbi:hypothetical protein [Vibrio paucivorans]|uniref:Uncharacterized protein n=1 Tax=Vibrio paucivorans TaxID=2829489 RepID=A0A9X3CE57_9VIBR|nr:hypothetical protein [Vibrio paucivorans]MCW8333976.1 hypothetical protein [Vibrio paucivorans]
MHLALKASAVCAALAVGFFASDILSVFNQQSGSKPIDDYCVLSTEGCTQQNVTMSLNSDIAKPLVPIQVTIEWPNAQSDVLSLDMQGHEMDMGTAKYRLTRTQGDQFQGEIILPVCTQEQMTWLGTLSDGNQDVFPAIRMEQ